VATRVRSIAIIGSTGSIGRQALDVVRANPQRFRVAALAAGSNVERLAQQANEFRPDLVCIGSAALAADLRSMLAYGPPEIVSGSEGLRRVAVGCGADVLLAASDGMAALHGVVESLEAGKHVALANKELLVAAGHLLCPLARSAGATLVPVDSEHSAIFQCLQGEDPSCVERVVITASGGPFYDLAGADLERVTAEQALRHPVWSMGPKNTLDSATLMNKGLEMIEASYLFGLPPGRVEAVIHRQSLVHGLVFFRDGSVKAQLASPDMRLPIGYALAYPERVPVAVGEEATRRALGLAGAAVSLTFEPVDATRFPAVSLACSALAKGPPYPAVLSAANDEAGRAFLRGQIRFTDICRLVERALASYAGPGLTLEDILAADRFGRASVREAIDAAVQH
jgi:1-deoxy-D-xylulose-5-phosphate reductoisomerase